jgi:hypothetical protein
VYAAECPEILSLFIAALPGYCEDGFIAYITVTSYYMPKDSVARPLPLTKMKPNFKIQSSLGTNKIWSWVPKRFETKNYCAGEDR